MHRLLELEQSFVGGVRYQNKIIKWYFFYSSQLDLVLKASSHGQIDFGNCF